MRTAIALYLLAFGARLVVLLHFPDPAYPDSYYYVDVARNLAAGHGLNVDFIWIFAEVGGKLPANAILPIPANGHWMPLASFVQVPFILALGPTAIASALPFAFIGAAAAPLTWAIARDAGTTRLVAVGAGVLVAFPVLMLVFMVQPDNFALYQTLVAATLWLTARGLRGDGRSFAIAGLLVGLAVLSRTDGALVVATLGLAVVWDRWHAWRSHGTRPAQIRLRAIVASAVLFSIVVLPWVIRQFATFGTLSPSTASGKVLYIRSIAEWNSITTPATLDWLLGQGIGPLALSRIGGLVSAIGIFATLACAGALVIPLVVGAWHRRRSVWFGPFFAYAALLFAFSTFVSAVHVPGGTFIHSAAALVPHTYILALEGIGVGVSWIAARRRSWNAAAATRLFTTVAVVAGVTLSIVTTLGVHATWSQKRADRDELAAALALASGGDDSRVMSIDAAGIEYSTGHGGVVSPNDPIETVQQVADAYRIQWLILERDSIVGSLAPVLTGTSRPSWIGPPVLTIPSTDGGPPRAGLYPVCLSPNDQRCTIVANGQPGPAAGGPADLPAAGSG